MSKGKGKGKGKGKNAVHQNHVALATVDGLTKQNVKITFGYLSGEPAASMVVGDGKEHVAVPKSVLTSVVDIWDFLLAGPRGDGGPPLLFDAGRIFLRLALLDADEVALISRVGGAAPIVALPKAAVEAALDGWAMTCPVCNAN